MKLTEHKKALRGKAENNAFFVYSLKKKKLGRIAVTSTLWACAKMAPPTDHDDAVGLEVGLGEELPQQHAVSHVLDARALARAVLEPDAVARLCAHLHAHLFSNTCRHRHSSDTTGLFDKSDIFDMFRIKTILNNNYTFRRLKTFI